MISENRLKNTTVDWPDAVPFFVAWVGAAGESEVLPVGYPGIVTDSDPHAVCVIWLGKEHESVTTGMTFYPYQLRLIDVHELAALIKEMVST